jgi:hypothetical protein
MFQEDLHPEKFQKAVPTQVSLSDWEQQLVEVKA